jgi:GH24 family phage-related lysozyme (muramidase)
MEIKISVASAHIIAAEELHYRRVSARWIPRRLTPETKERRRDVCFVLLGRYEQQAETFLKRIITGDESQCTFSHQKTKALVQNGSIKIHLDHRQSAHKLQTERRHTLFSVITKERFLNITCSKDKQ